MAIEKGERFANTDVYIDYPFEKVMYRWDHLSQRIFVKFYGKEEASAPVAFSNGLFNDALLSGHEISRKEYERGKSDHVQSR